MNEDLDKLQSAYEATTQGEWTEDFTDDIRVGNVRIATFHVNIDNYEADRDFCIVAHNAFPALLAELRELRERETVEEIEARLLQEVLVDARKFLKELKEKEAAHR
jgi:hypothetical protein